MSEEDANYRRGYNKGYAAGKKAASPSEASRTSLRGRQKRCASVRLGRKVGAFTGNKAKPSVRAA